MEARTLSGAVKREAHSLGFDYCRILPLQEAAHSDFFEGWLGLGRAGEMRYLARHADKRRNPALLADQGSPFRSLVVLGVDYHQFDLPARLLADPRRGIIARYAWGDDYHEIIRPLLYELDGLLREHSGRSSPGKGLVDSGPVLERSWAQRAGLGFSGKNCCTIHPVSGSWLFLATLLVPEALAYDPPALGLYPSGLGTEAVLAGLPAGGDYGAWRLQPVGLEERGVEAGGSASNRNLESGGEGQLATCGHCTRCLASCPTDAFVGPFHLDPLRCISYWTIESRKPIPRRLRGLFGNRIFGCDICQETCPWNRRLAQRTPRLRGLRAQLGRVAPPLLEGFDPGTPYWLAPDAFAERWRRSPLKRAKRSGMLRNVCVALGNWGDPQAFPALAAAQADDEALVRGHAAWALGRLLRAHHDERAASCLRDNLAGEADEWVREELHAALGGDETFATNGRKHVYRGAATGAVAEQKAGKD